VITKVPSGRIPGPKKKSKKGDEGGSSKVEDGGTKKKKNLQVGKLGGERSLLVGVTTGGIGSWMEGDSLRQTRQ